jgi:hypothetical protein
LANKGSSGSGNTLLYAALGFVGGIFVSQIFSSQVKGVWEQIPVINQLDNQFGGAAPVATKSNYSNSFNAISLEGRRMSYN